jgi:transcription initiation factor IIE alpha subunit
MRKTGERVPFCEMRTAQRENKIIEIVAEKPNLTSAQIASESGIRKWWVERALRQLKEAEVLVNYRRASEIPYRWRLNNEI